MQQQQKYDFAIIGGGVYGLSIAYHLAKTQKSIALFQRFTIGHSNGSSHGPQRITRSVYEKEFYRDMNTLALKQYWPEVEKVLSSKLIYSNPFIWYDQRSKQYQQFARVARSATTKVKFMTPQQICTTFPSMPLIPCSNLPIVDFEAAMIAADDYVMRLGQYLKTLPNIAIFENAQIKSILKNPKQVSITTQTETTNAEKVVVAAGRWVTELLPELKDLFVVAKQHLAYLNLQQPQLYQFGRIPSFVYQGSNVSYYTTPDRKGMGYKIGSHNLLSDLREEGVITKEVRDSHEKVAKRLFKQKLKGVNKFDQCYYTATKTQDFIIDWVDPEQKILVCSCCSGHGFKFSPLIGKIVSDLLVNNKSIDLFQKYRFSCQIPYHRGVNLK